MNRRSKNMPFVELSFDVISYAVLYKYVKAGNELRFSAPTQGASLTFEVFVIVVVFSHCCNNDIFCVDNFGTNGVTCQEG